MDRLVLSGFFCVLACLFLLLPPIGKTVTSQCATECCEGCVLKKYSKGMRTVRVCAQKSRQVTYYTSCGFLWLSRCARSRTGYYSDCQNRDQYYTGVNSTCKPNCACLDP